MSARESGLLASNSRKQKLTIGMCFGLAVVIIGLGFSIQVLFRRKAKEKKYLAGNLGSGTMSRFQLGEITVEQEDLELPLFNTATVLAATSNLFLNNKIGEGGFGPVYKGVLKDGREIAVKKLSPSSKQGLDLLKNEVTYIAKLQHRNLAKLYGCCLQEQNLLIYEYIPNGSLDSFIFDPMQRKLLDWKKRFDILLGIMNPKISDFGLAEDFIGNETGANTTMVVGTYGYMSPEYAIRGTFSMKSDVISYSVLVLEIAWKLFVGEREPLDLLDKEIVGSHDASEVLRCIQVGLLCVVCSDAPRIGRAWTKCC
ncbi:hypothetical protein MLD38_012692 [Melastoma candidum]|uniref:Uncharacterized protein n=1 Tax=Melastoma candidum TaxID=119954 RepID=A0ACB9R755_9MYRT|nr:hypothetical protein MLD38_012692 [Melastoma candidum]